MRPVLACSSLDMDTKTRNAENQRQLLCFSSQQQPSIEVLILINTYELYCTSYWTEHDINIKVFYGNKMSNFTLGTREHMYYNHK